VVIFELVIASFRVLQPEELKVLLSTCYNLTLEATHQTPPISSLDSYTTSSTL
jgi:hypothetical protein